MACSCTQNKEQRAAKRREQAQKRAELREAQKKKVSNAKVRAS